MAKVAEAFRIYRCWKCKREVTLSPEEHRQERAGIAFRRPLRLWKCDCGGELMLHRLTSGPVSDKEEQ